MQQDCQHFMVRMFQRRRLMNRAVPPQPSPPQPRRPYLRRRREAGYVLPIKEILDRDRGIYRRPQLLFGLQLDAGEPAHSLGSRVQVILELRTVTPDARREQRPFSLIGQLHGTLVSSDLW